MTESEIQIMHQANQETPTTKVDPENLPPPKVVINVMNLDAFVRNQSFIEEEKACPQFL